MCGVILPVSGPVVKKHSLCMLRGIVFINRQLPSAFKLRIWVRTINSKIISNL